MSRQRTSLNRIEFYRSAALGFTLGILSSLAAANAQQGSSQGFEQNPILDTSNLAVVPRVVSAYELWLCVLITTFATVVVVIQYRILSKSTLATADAVMKTFLLTFLVAGALLLVAAGFNAQEVSPVIGLFGTIAGYLLGKEVGKGAAG